MTSTREPVAGRPLTIAEIAERAGVSVATVSKVVNGRSDVAEQTRGLVERVIGEYGYRRQRRPARSAALLELVVNELGGEYLTEVIAGVDRVAREHRLAMVVSELQGRLTPGRGWIEEVLARRPTGVVAAFCSPTEAQVEQLRTRGIPLILVDSVGEPSGPSPGVGATAWNGGLVATRHLLELGHRRIGVITGPTGLLCSRARLDGYRVALDGAGVPADPDLIRGGDFSVEAGRAYTRELLALPDPPTAVFTCSDNGAIGAYRAADEAGLRVPRDLSVVGFNDIPAAAWLTPSLTTVRQPLAEMAAAATTMAVTLARGDTLRYSHAILATELVVRDSTAPPPSR